MASCGGPGVQRWLKFVKYFRDFEIEPVVYIPENPNYPLVDNRFSSEVSKDIEILKHPIKEPYRFANILSKKKTKAISSGIISEKEPSAIENLMLYIRGNFFIPDARVGWVKPSVQFLSDYLQNNDIDVVITTGPPHSLHLIGMELKKKLNIKWIADFRDPWTTIHYHKSLKLSKSSEKKHKQLESKVLNSADVIVVTSPTTKKEFKSITNQPIHVITNGYDVSEEIQVSLDKEFSISHIGSLLSGRNPEVLWQVLKELTDENTSFSSDLKLKFAGAVSDEVKLSLAKYKLLEKAEFLGYVSHTEALKLQRQSQLLLLVEIDREETRAIIPGKLFEYLAACRPIVALGPEQSDIEAILVDTQSGDFFDYHQKETLKTNILQHYGDYQKGELNVHSKGIKKYSRRELTRQMATLIQQFS